MVMIPPATILMAEQEAADRAAARTPRPPYDFSAFDRVMGALDVWRNADHEDAMWLHRNHIIEIIEGVKALRR